MVSKIKVDEIEASQGSNITFNHTAKVDIISEKTSAAGVTIDGLLIKDGAIPSIAGGLTVADQYDITSNITSTQTVITNWARPTGTLQGNLGSGITETSGIFSFPSTGYYLVNFYATLFITTGSPGYMQIKLFSTNDDFATEDTLWNIAVSTPSNQAHMGEKSVILDITDVSNQKIKLTVPVETGTCSIAGSTTETRSAIQFYKLGDT